MRSGYLLEDVGGLSGFMLNFIDGTETALGEPAYEVKIGLGSWGRLVHENVEMFR